MIRRILMSMALMVLVAASAFGRTINIHGVITIKGTGEAASGAGVFDAATHRLLSVADEDGRYNVTFNSEGQLMFSHMVCEDKTVDVDGRLEINVSLTPETKELDEVVVTAKGRSAGILTEPTDLDLAGNTMRLRTKVRVPSRMLDSDVRLIIQPAIYNVTRRHLSYLSPVVVDGWHYAITQERMYDWDSTRDSLNAYTRVKHTPNRKEGVIHITDSLFVENPTDDYMGVIMSSIEDYNHILYTGNFEIARGTVNPLRFLSYSLKPMGMNEEKFLPTPEMELRDASGEINLLFPVGKSKLDMSLGNNAKELNAMIAELKKIEQDPNATLKSFTIYGSASPEGRYEVNKSLADARMQSAMDKVLSSIDPSLRKNADISSRAKVASWEDVVTMLRADGLNDEADQVQRVINRTPNGDGRSWAMTRLPFYKSLLADKYLPRLRRVNYSIVSSAYRPLTDDEIAALYRTNPSGLSKYQFYRYYSTLKGEEREKAIRRALAAHPDFMVAATDLSEIMLDRGENPSEILEPFFVNPEKWERLPVSTRLNMGEASMMNMQFSRADSILSTIPDTPQTHKAII
ncbi:MAG: carboxypeptidase-like regulatory domain-containing protein, partial [Muribaculaceae bacterium]|nr:carboxypeptidase-like regulatory domain-containing protein [Muribaculaceae bacterium]